MRAFVSLLACFVVLLSGTGYARKGFDSKDMKWLAKTTVADSAENDYDVKHVKFNLNMTDTSIYISGDVTTDAMVVVPSMDTYTFELDSLITIDSVKFNGQLLPAQTVSSTVRKIALTSAVPQNSMFTVQVFYHGQASVNNGFFTGITHSVSQSGVNMVYTVSDPYAGKDWWTCKQSLDDKIDSADIWITVPQGLKAGSNGLLQNISIPAPGYQRYEWKTRYAIDYYLLSVAVAPYFDYSYYMHFTGSTDSMLVQNYLYDSATFMPAYKANFDSVGLMVDYLSTLYGRYPFYQEKYGHCFTTLGGGMEHQTMTTIGTTSTPLIAHELGHQWFGDHVTYSRWGDVWLSEGFATYTEQLYIEHFWSQAAMLAYRSAQYSYVTSKPGGTVYVHDTTTVDSLFDQRLVYDKAAGVIHMLRTIAPSDSSFFAVLKDYQQQYGFGLASTVYLQQIAEQVYGRSLDTFFNQWIYGQGYPIYSIKWNQINDQVYLRLAQTTSLPSSVPLFVMPVQVELKSLQGDTVVTVYNNQSVQLYNVTWAQPISLVKVEPYNNIIHKNGIVQHDTTLNVQLLSTSHIKVYPNPARDYWKATNIPTGSTLILLDMDGRAVWQSSSNQSVVTIPGQKLASGTYLLKVQQGTDTATLRLTHW